MKPTVALEKNNLPHHLYFYFLRMWTKFPAYTADSLSSKAIIGANQALTGTLQSVRESSTAGPPMRVQAPGVELSIRASRDHQSWIDSGADGEVGYAPSLCQSNKLDIVFFIYMFLLIECKEGNITALERKYNSKS